MKTEISPIDSLELPRTGVPAGRSVRTYRKRSGFSVIEIMLAVVIIGILAALAIPAFQKIRHKTNVTKFVHDLRTISGQFEGYHFAEAQWPANTPAGQLPAEVAGYVNEGSFTQTNAVGSQWKWHNSGVVGLAVEHGGTDREIILYRAIAEQIDEGTLMDGRFRFDDGKNIVVWILNE